MLHFITIYIEYILNIFPFFRKKKKITPRAHARAHTHTHPHTHKSVLKEKYNLNCFYILIKNECIITDDLICLFIITDSFEFRFPYSFNTSLSWVFFSECTMCGEEKLKHLFRWLLYLSRRLRYS